MGMTVWRYAPREVQEREDALNGLLAGVLCPALRACSAPSDALGIRDPAAEKVEAPCLPQLAAA
eukprot:10922557-Heterocapsa_arctica.AAC.1